MQKPSNNPRFASMKRVMQKEYPYCGPATLEMLLSFIGVETNQDELIEASGVGRRIVEYGMSIFEMGKAVGKLFPDFTFWFKDEGEISDLKNLILTHKFPVGVEWQGDFPDMESEDLVKFGYNEDDDDDDAGHYSVVTHVDTQGNAVYIADPFGPFAGKDRRFSVVDFARRWWDINEIIDPFSGKHRHVHDYHMLFVITPKSATFPETLGMVTVAKELNR
jgi:hypothetical protein